MSGLILAIPEVPAMGATPIVEGAAYKGLEYAGKAFLDFLTGAALLILTPFHFLIGRAMYETKELAREVEHPFYPSEPDHYTDPDKSGFHKILIAVNAIGDVIRGHFAEAGSNWWMISLPIIVAIFMVGLLYVVMIFAPFIILVMNFFVTLFTIWVQVYATVVDLVVLPVLAGIAPVYNTILAYMWTLVVSVFFMVCPNATGASINPVNSCPILEQVVTFTQSSSQLFLSLAQTFYNAIASAFQSFASSICPGYQENVSVGVCLPSICQAAGFAGQCGFSGTVIGAWVAQELQKVLVALLPVLDLLLAFSFDMASLLFQTLDNIVTGGYDISDRTEAQALANQAETLFTQGLPSYFQSLMDNNFVSDSQVEQTDVAAAYQPFKEFLLIVEGYAYDVTTFLTSVLGDLLITFDTLICNIFNSPWKCIIGKFCYLIGEFLGDATLNNAFCNAIQANVVGPTNQILCPCDQCEYNGLVSGMIASLKVYNYVSSPCEPFNAALSIWNCTNQNGFSLSSYESANLCQTFVIGVQCPARPINSTYPCDSYMSPTVYGYPYVSYYYTCPPGVSGPCFYSQVWICDISQLGQTISEENLSTQYTQYPLPSGCTFLYPQAMLGVYNGGLFVCSSYMAADPSLGLPPFYTPAQPILASDIWATPAQVNYCLPMSYPTTYMCSENLNNFPVGIPFVVGQSILVPCIFNPSPNYCVNMNTACGKGLSILSDLSPF